MTIAQTIQSNSILKKIALWMMMPRYRAKPREWVNWIITPFFITKGKRSKIHSTVRLDILPVKPVKIGNYSVIEDYCTVNNGVGNIIIGDNTRIGIGSTLIGPVNIGNDVRLAQNVVVSGLNHNYNDISVPISQQGVSTDEVYIGDESWIGANAVILPGIFIGKHCVVAAGSVVTKNVPSYSVVAGNPAKLVKQYNKENNKWEKVKPE